MSGFKKAIIISGATACGKSSLALKLAQDLKGEIINADAIQIYQDLPILSAQPSLDDQKEVKHHLYGFLAKEQKFSVVDWLSKLEIVARSIFEKNSLPIIVGGSGMYISKLILGISEIPEISKEVSKFVEREFFEKGLEKILQKIAIPKIKDKQRALRAYEVLLQTGKPITYWQDNYKKYYLNDINFIHFNLNIDRDLLYQRCDKRFNEMIENGVIQEVESLVNNSQSVNLPISKTLGFKEINDYLLNKISYEEMIKLASQYTRNYAKRQLTWFRNQLRSDSLRHQRFDINNIDQIKSVLQNQQIL